MCLCLPSRSSAGPATRTCSRSGFLSSSTTPPVCPSYWPVPNWIFVKTSTICQTILAWCLLLLHREKNFANRLVLHII
ncbi:rac-like GTP-binding protein 3 isoform X1 [Iris pallida]|uniref:Rac-like GTP-binding protein 3 isoform X1 n=1 Tax=Iris pallida TaxID=29817 RepID=A0AAX6F7F8_IRIPA|nr:rac-like GTP-binding protein 3 isoform X1 [Iris pallida]